jgi:hypothetical protein
LSISNELYTLLVLNISVDYLFQVSRTSLLRSFEKTRYIEVKWHFKKQLTAHSDRFSCMVLQKVLVEEYETTTNQDDDDQKRISIYMLGRNSFFIKREEKN